MIGVVLADGEDRVRGELRAVLAAESGIAVLGETGAGVDVPGLVRELRPDVVLMDVRMPTSGVLASGARVLVLTAFGNDADVYAAMLAGAAGFLLKRARPVEVVAAVRTVAAGESLLFPAAVRDLVATLGRRRGAPVELTREECGVLGGTARGLTDAEIARHLALPVETVAGHSTALLARLGARTRTQAVLKAYELGLLDPHQPPD